MSMLTYGITIWGWVIEKSLMKKLQRVQNLTIRWILGENKYTPTTKLLEDIKWMSINQLIKYHCLLQYWKLEKYKEPERIFEWTQQNKNTTNRIDMTGKVFSGKTPVIFDSLPQNIKNTPHITSFKKHLKVWILENIPIYMEE